MFFIKKTQSFRLAMLLSISTLMPPAVFFTFANSDSKLANAVAELWSDAIKGENADRREMEVAYEKALERLLDVYFDKRDPDGVEVVNQELRRTRANIRRLKDGSDETPFQDAPIKILPYGPKEISEKQKIRKAKLRQFRRIRLSELRDKFGALQKDLALKQDFMGIDVIQKELERIDLEIKETENVYLANDPKVLKDAADDIRGDLERKYLDLSKASMNIDARYYELVVETNSILPEKRQMRGGKQIDFILFVDADCKKETGQLASGNDYNVHATLSEEGWKGKWYKVSKFAKQDSIRVKNKEIEATSEGDKVTLRFPRKYLPSETFEWWIQTTTVNAPDWEPVSGDTFARRCKSQVKNSERE